MNAPTGKLLHACFCNNCIILHYHIALLEQHLDQSLELSCTNIILCQLFGGNTCNPDILTICHVVRKGIKRTASFTEMAGICDQLTANVARKGIAIATGHLVTACFSHKGTIAARTSSNISVSHALFN